MLSANIEAAPGGAGRPVRHAGLAEKSIKNQLFSTSEQIRQVHLAFGSEEAIVLLNERHRHSSPSGLSVGEYIDGIRSANLPRLAYHLDKVRVLLED